MRKCNPTARGGNIERCLRLGLFDFLKKKAPKGIDNPYKYYPEEYAQDSSQSIIDSDGIYDLTRFSAHEESIIKQVISNVRKKYPEKYRAIGLANESYVIVYKPRYVLFEIIILKYKDSTSPLDMVAVSFAYCSKGAQFRSEALRYYEAVRDKINFDELNEFASVSILSYITKIAETYEKEHEYKKAAECYKYVYDSGEGNSQYFADKITELSTKELKPLRKRKIGEKQIKFEENVTLSAKRYIDLL